MDDDNRQQVIDALMRYQQGQQATQPIMFPIRRRLLAPISSGMFQLGQGLLQQYMQQQRQPTQTTPNPNMNWGQYGELGPNINTTPYQ